MKNTKSLTVLIATTAAIFQEEKYKDINVVYASEDGFTFIDENRAQIHCKGITDMKYHSITRTQALQDQETIIDTSEKDSNPPAEAKDKDPDPEAAKELEQLKAQYEELYGKAAHHNIGAEKLKTLIAEKLAGSNDQQKEGGNNNDQQPA